MNNKDLLNISDITLCCSAELVLASAKELTILFHICLWVITLTNPRGDNWNIATVIFHDILANGNKIFIGSIKNGCFLDASSTISPTLLRFLKNVFSLVLYE